MQEQRGINKTHKQGRPNKIQEKGGKQNTQKWGDKKKQCGTNKTHEQNSKCDLCTSSHVHTEVLIEVVPT